MNVIVNGEYQRSDLWPSCNWLYNVAVGGRRETRGSVAFLLPIGALVVLLVLDVRFPLLFWNLRHGLEVYGGEQPTGITRCRGGAALPASSVFLCWRR